MLPRSWRVIALGVLVAAVVVPASILRVNAQVKLPPAVLPQNPVIGQVTVNQGTPVPIYAVSLDVKNTIVDVGGGGQGTGQAQFSDISIQKAVDALSTDLFRLALLGEHVPQVRIELYSSGTTTVASTFLLQNVVVTGFATAGGGLENISFHYERLTLGTSGAPYCWDLAQNKAC
jgi:type VI protein secretion system component Hcp